MEVSQTAIALSIGLGAGVLSGMFGIGGGVIIVPALVLAGLSLTEAAGTSLTALLLPVGLAGVLVYRRAKLIDFRAGLLVAAGLMTTVILGAWLATDISGHWLRRLYAIFLLYVSWRFIHPVQRFRAWQTRRAEAAGQPQTSQSGFPPVDMTDQPHHHSWVALLSIGLAAGVLSGLFGVGGGAIIVPVLIGTLDFPPKRAVATSLTALLPPVGLPGVLLHASRGTLHLEYAWPVALGLLAGALFGAKITVKLPVELIKLLYGLFLVVMAIHFAVG